MYTVYMTSASLPGPRRPATTPDLIAEAVRDDIQAGAFPPGAALRQEDLAARFGVSRIPVRDALRRLQAEGLVELLPNRGAFVSRLSPDEIREVYDMRVLLEGDLIARAARAMTPERLAVLRRAMDQAEHAAGRPDWQVLDDAFHGALYAPAGRPRQLALVEHLRGVVQRYVADYGRLAEETPRWLADHRAMVEACERADGDAARAALERHLRGAEAFVAERLG